MPSQKNLGTYITVTVPRFIQIKIFDKDGELEVIQRAVYHNGKTLYMDFSC